MTLRRTRLASLLSAHAALAIGAFVVAVPFYWLICAAFKPNEDFFNSLFLPRGEGFLGIAWSHLTLEHVRTLFAETGMARALLTSIFLSSVTAVLATLCCAMAGYALAKMGFRGKRGLTWLVLLAVIIPGPLLIAPGYQMLYHLNLLNTFAGLILPAMAPAFGVYLFRQASLSSVPTPLLEAARIDGCGEIRSFFAIALPLLRPMIGTFLLLTFLGTWNNFIAPQVVLQEPGKFPLAVAVAQLRGVYYQDYGMLMAGTLLSILPVMVLFLVLQREFIAGLTAGAVKG
jgi:ABC-type glycerol-3-phosphate transport system permease component